MLIATGPLRRAVARAGSRAAARSAGRLPGAAPGTVAPRRMARGWMAPGWMAPGWMAMAAAVLAGAGLLAAAGCARAAPPGFPGGPASSPGSAGPGAAPRTVAAALNGRQRAALQVMSGATSVTVGTAALGGDLIRASVQAGGGVRPQLVLSGNTVQLFLASAGTSGPATVRITLNSAVTWRLTFSGGSTLTAVFLGHGRLRGADFTAGSSQITLRLPRPRGTVPIVLAGGASQVTVTAPRGVAARLRLDGGAGSALLGGHAYTGIAGGTLLTPPGWTAAVSRYDIEAPAGISAITVGHW